jgi:dTDP-glucose 4,6-dehydratase
MSRVLLTGASGFVGAHVLRHLLTNTDHEIVCPVTFRHKGVMPRLDSTLEDQDLNRLSLIMLDLTAPIDRVTASRIGPVDYILNVASESHVDRSITDPVPFVRNNLDLMLNVLEFARFVRPKMLLQMSTDEVYGPAPQDYRHKEWDAIKPSNPYSASKAIQESVCFSYWRTYGVPVVITNTMNIIGEMQDPEKFVPKVLKSIYSGQPVPMHVSPEGVPGSRFYLHARNLADAWLYLMDNHAPQMYPEYTAPSRFNIVGEREVTNLEMIQLIEKFVGSKADVFPVNFHKSRPGHDLRYALDGTKLASLGWEAPVPFEESLKRTVHWYIENEEWFSL